MSTQPQITNHIDLGTVTVDQVLDFAAASSFALVAGANLNISVKNLKPGQLGGLSWTQDATGSRTLTWATGTGIATVSAATAPGLAPVATASLITEFTLRGTSALCATARIVGRAIV